MRPLEPLCTAGGDVKWYSFGKWYEGSSNPAVPLLDIYPKELKAGTQIYLYDHIHCSIIHKKVEATQVSINR